MSNDGDEELQPTAPRLGQLVGVLSVNVGIYGVGFATWRKAQVCELCQGTKTVRVRVMRTNEYSHEEVRRLADPLWGSSGEGKEEAEEKLLWMGSETIDYGTEPDRIRAWDDVFWAAYDNNPRTYAKTCRVPAGRRQQSCQQRGRCSNHIGLRRVVLRLKKKLKRVLQ